MKSDCVTDSIVADWLYMLLYHHEVYANHYYFIYDIGTNSLTISLLFLHYIVKEIF